MFVTFSQFFALISMNGIPYFFDNASPYLTWTTLSSSRSNLLATSIFTTSLGACSFICCIHLSEYLSAYRYFKRCDLSKSNRPELFLQLLCSKPEWHSWNVPDQLCPKSEVWFFDLWQWLFWSWSQRLSSPHSSLWIYSSRNERECLFFLLHSLRLW